MICPQFFACPKQGQPFVLKSCPHFLIYPKVRTNRLSSRKPSCTKGLGHFEDKTRTICPQTSKTICPHKIPWGTRDLGMLRTNRGQKSLKIEDKNKNTNLHLNQPESATNRITPAFVALFVVSEP